MMDRFLLLKQKTTLLAHTADVIIERAGADGNLSSLRCSGDFLRPATAAARLGADLLQLVVYL
jgi:hypothetical protein